jgi:hypothetical protein
MMVCLRSFVGIPVAAAVPILIDNWYCSAKNDKEKVKMTKMKQKRIIVNNLADRSQLRLILFVTSHKGERR